MALPINVGFGTVIGKFIDSEGGNVEGTVTFTPSPKALLNVAAVPPVTILPRPVVAALVDGAFTVDLVASDDPDNNPVGWTYAVSFQFTGGALAGFSIEVLEGTTVDLSVVGPVAASGGVAIVVGPEGPAGPPGEGAELTSYVGQVESLSDYPASFPPAAHNHDGVYATSAQGALADTAVQDTTPLGAGVDLDTLKQTGSFSQASHDDAGSGSNYPVDRAGVLEVFSSADDTQIAQFYSSRWNPDGSYGTANQYTRVYFEETGWSVWRRPVYTDERAVAYAELPAGVTLTVFWSGTAWPTRPTSRTDIPVIWTGGTEAVPPPMAGFEGVDKWDKEEVA